MLDTEVLAPIVVEKLSEGIPETLNDFIPIIKLLTKKGLIVVVKDDRFAFVD